MPIVALITSRRLVLDACAKMGVQLVLACSTPASMNRLLVLVRPMLSDLDISSTLGHILPCRSSSVACGRRL
jgi:hypothetical protein